MPSMKSHMILKKLPSFYALGQKQMCNAGHEIAHDLKGISFVLALGQKQIRNAGHEVS